MDVSIIVPVYNVEKYIRPSLATLAAQTHPRFEIILVDDGSTDASGAICDEFAAMDSRFKVIHKENEGAGYARNTGLDAAQGEYVYFCDPDDLTDPHLVEDNYRLAKETQADLVVFGYQTVWMNEDGSLRDKKELHLPLLRGTYDYKAFWDHFREECGLEYSLACRMYRRRYLEEHQLRMTNLSNGEDASFIFCTYATPFHRIVYHQKVYYTYIRRKGSATTVFKPQRMETEYQVSRRFDEAVSGSPHAQGRYTDLIQRKYVMGMNMALSNLAQAGRTVPMKEKVCIIRAALTHERLKWALKTVPLRIFWGRGTWIKVLLLRWGMYRLAIGLVALKNLAANH